MVPEPKIIGNVCLTSHHIGLKKGLEEQIAYVESQSAIEMPGRVLVIGGSTGYGLATRVAAAFAGCATTLNVSFEKEPTERKPGSVGWYNNYYFDSMARARGLQAESLNLDAFSNEARQKVIQKIREMMGQIDLFVYSLASPVRKDPESGKTYKSVLKPLGSVYTARSVDFISETVSEVTIEPAKGEDKAHTIKVMGGEDWSLWVKALLEAGVLAEGLKTVAYSYIGPQITYAVYRDGTIGAAKKDLEDSAKSIRESLKGLNGDAFVSVNKALVTRASSVIPVVPLYISLLFGIMKKKGLHEGCIEQMYRMLSSRIYGSQGVLRDAEGLVRLDDREMREDVQKEIMALWDKVTTENIRDISDIEGFRKDYMRLHGFEWDGVDYSADIDFRVQGE